MCFVVVWLRTVLLNIDYATSRLQVLLQHEKECLCICVQMVCSVEMKSIVPFFLSYILCVLFVFKKGKKEKKKGTFLHDANCKVPFDTQAYWYCRHILVNVYCLVL